MGSYLTTETLCAGFKNLLAFTKLPHSTYTKKYSHLQNLNLADSRASCDIDLLIGSGYYWDLVTGKVKTGKPGEPVAVETVFGWILNGPVANKFVDSSTNLNIFRISHALFLNLSKFWDLKTLGISLDEKGICENFLDCIYKNSEKKIQGKTAI